MSKPSIVLHVSAHFSHVIEKLEDQGYVCLGVSLPTNTRDPLVDGRLLGIEDDVAAIRAAVTNQLDAGNDVVVVTHSYGTVPGTAALTGLNIKARKTAGNTNGVVGAANLPPQYLLETNTTLPFAGPGAIDILYNDIDHNEALKAV
ncbi:hypothetical protein D6C76_09952 [Aureobasidium pullulans]|nr:hypothetical protein D6C76_09952 [Aureobasidium pullulans]